MHHKLNNSTKSIKCCEKNIEKVYFLIVIIKNNNLKAVFFTNRLYSHSILYSLNVYNKQPPNSKLKLLTKEKKKHYI